jgi:1-deoxy-D-xylulose-5-phosphate reductoisomerase
MIGVAVLGSTGSIGQSTLDVLARHPQRYQVTALTANTDVDSLFAQCEAYQPQMVAMADTASAEQLASRLAKTLPDVEVLAGEEGLAVAAAHKDTDYVMAAIVGAAGLAPTLAAVRQGKRILLANKEALVVAGDLFMAEVAQYGAELLPIDSEHNALFQCMPQHFAEGLQQAGIERILLTASGGPFRNHSLAELAEVTPEQACAHPNWDMGRKISVDSASMMNKGLEVIEAHWLFNARPDQIEVVVHPQSVIHSLVSYADGSVLAQLGNPDMRTPIAHALAWPDRHSSGVAQLDLAAIARLDFSAPDMQRFPCLRLAFEAIEAGGTASAILNAANEVAVDAFLRDELAFLAIPRIIEATLEKMPHTAVDSLAALLEIDQVARECARLLLRSLK